MDKFDLNEDQERWAKKRRPHYGLTRANLRQLIRAQEGRCALSKAPLLFDRANGVPQKNGYGCHPLYPAIDHKDPGNSKGGFQVVCYALNDLKGHLPLDCFNALKKTRAWCKLMRAWRLQAKKDPTDREAFRKLLRPNATLRTSVSLGVRAR